MTFVLIALLRIMSAESSCTNPRIPALLRAAIRRFDLPILFEGPRYELMFVGKLCSLVKIWFPQYTLYFRVLYGVSAVCFIWKDHDGLFGGC